MSDEQILQFPCEFPIKVMGKASDDFEVSVLAIVHKHFPDMKENSIRTNFSKDNNFESLTVTVNASSKDELDALYIELNACDAVIMVL